MEQSLYEILEKYCKDNGKEFEKEFLTNLQEKLFQRKDDLVRTLKRATKKAESYKSKNAGLGTFYSLVRQLHLLYNIPLSVFDVNRDEVGCEIRDSTITTLVLKLPKNRHEPQKETEALEKFSEDYKKALNEPLTKLQSSLKVYDYLEKFTNDVGSINKYHDVHKELYASIEGRISEVIKSGSSISYYRYLALPKKREQIQLKRNVLDDEKTLDEIILQVLTACSENLFRHIVSCLSKFPDLCNSDPPGSGFYAVANARRTYHYATFDSGEYVMSEYYMYSRQGSLRPAIMFVEQRAKDSPLARHYEAEFASFIDLDNLGNPMIPKPKITLSGIEKCIGTIVAKAEAEYNASASLTRLETKTNLNLAIAKLNAWNERPKPILFT